MIPFFILFYVDLSSSGIGLEMSDDSCDEFDDASCQFFSGFSSSGEKSTRKRQRELNKAKSEDVKEMTAADKMLAVEKAKKAIAAAVLGRASAKEKEQARKENRQQRKAKKNGGKKK